MNTPDRPPRSELRQALRSQRQSLPAAQRIKAAQAVREALARLPAFSTARHVAGYWACAGEVPLNLVLADIAQRGQHYWLPRIGPGRRLEFARWEAGDPIVANRYGIPEPTDDAPTLPAAALDMVLVPLLGFDAAGNRLGMGGGYYDTAFGFLRTAPRPAKPLLTGIAHPFQQVPQLEPEPWDVALDHVVAGAELINCNDARNMS